MNGTGAASRPEGEPDDIGPPLRERTLVIDETEGFRHALAQPALQPRLARDRQFALRVEGDAEAGEELPDIERAIVGDRLIEGEAHRVKGRHGGDRAFAAAEKG